MYIVSYVLLLVSDIGHQFKRFCFVLVISFRKSVCVSYHYSLCYIYVSVVLSIRQVGFTLNYKHLCLVLLFLNANQITLLHTFLSFLALLISNPKISRNFITKHKDIFVTI